MATHKSAKHWALASSGRPGISAGGRAGLQARHPSFGPARGPGCSPALGQFQEARAGGSGRPGLERGRKLALGRAPGRRRRGLGGSAPRPPGPEPCGPQPGPPGLLLASDLGSPGPVCFLKKLPQEAQLAPPSPVFPELAGSSEGTGPSGRGLLTDRDPGQAPAPPVSPAENGDVPPHPSWTPQGPKGQLPGVPPWSRNLPGRTAKSLQSLCGPWLPAGRAVPPPVTGVEVASRGRSGEQPSGAGLGSADAPAFPGPRLYQQKRGQRPHLVAARTEGNPVEAPILPGSTETLGTHRRCRPAEIVAPTCRLGPEPGTRCHRESRRWETSQPPALGGTGRGGCWHPQGARRPRGQTHKSAKHWALASSGRPGISAGGRAGLQARHPSFGPARGPGCSPALGQFQEARAGGSGRPGLERGRKLALGRAPGRRRRGLGGSAPRPPGPEPCGPQPGPPGLLLASDLGSPGPVCFLKKLPQEAQLAPPSPVFPELAGSSEGTGPSGRGLLTDRDPGQAPAPPVSPAENGDVPPHPSWTPQGPKGQLPGVPPWSRNLPGRTAKSLQSLCGPWLPAGRAVPPPVTGVEVASRGRSGEQPSGAGLGSADAPAFPGPRLYHRKGDSVHTWLPRGRRVTL
eukprot:XP_028348978.1 collagen alpha-1(I) chain-like [Physeter catodon]